MENVKEMVHNFLTDRNQNQLTIVDKNRHTLWTKVKYDDNTDFIYGVCGYGKDYLVRTYDASIPGFGSIGIYNHAADVFVKYGYIPREYEYARSFTSSCMFEKMDNEVRVMSDTLVCGRHVPVPRNSEEYDYEISEYDINGMALDMYFGDVKKNRCVPRLFFHAEQIVEYLNSPAEFIDREAKEYIRTHAKAINHRLELEARAKERFEWLLSNVGEHTYMKRIRESMADAQTAKVKVVKDGMVFNGKITTSILNTMMSFWDYDFDNDTKKEMHRRGVYTINPSDIKEIKYRGKVIYSVE